MLTADAESTGGETGSDGSEMFNYEGGPLVTITGTNYDKNISFIKIPSTLSTDYGDAGVVGISPGVFGEYENLNSVEISTLALGGSITGAFPKDGDNNITSLTVVGFSSPILEEEHLNSIKSEFPNLTTLILKDVRTLSVNLSDLSRLTYITIPCNIIFGSDNLFNGIDNENLQITISTAEDTGEYPNSGDGTRLGTVVNNIGHYRTNGEKVSFGMCLPEGANVIISEGITSVELAFK